MYICVYVPNFIPDSTQTISNLMALYIDVPMSQILSRTMGIGSHWRINGASQKSFLHQIYCIDNVTINAHDWGQFSSFGFMATMLLLWIYHNYHHHSTIFLVLLSHDSWPQFPIIMSHLVTSPLQPFTSSIGLKSTSEKQQDGENIRKTILNINHQLIVSFEMKESPTCCFSS
jgi:hypothetical protein